MWLKPVKTVLFDWMALKIFVFHHFFSLSFPATGIRKRGDGNLFWLLLSQGSYSSTTTAQIFIKYLLLLLVYQQCNDAL